MCLVEVVSFKLPWTGVAMGASTAFLHRREHASLLTHALVRRRRGGPAQSHHGRAAEGAAKGLRPGARGPDPEVLAPARAAAASICRGRGGGGADAGRRGWVAIGLPAAPHRRRGVRLAEAPGLVGRGAGGFAVGK